MMLCWDLKNKLELTRRRSGGGKQFSTQKSELVKKVRSRGRGMQFWKVGARSGRAFDRNGKPANNFKQRNGMVKCAQRNRTWGRRSLCRQGCSPRDVMMPALSLGKGQERSGPSQETGWKQNQLGLDNWLWGRKRTQRGNKTQAIWHNGYNRNSAIKL